MSFFFSLNKIKHFFSIDSKINFFFFRDVEFFSRNKGGASGDTEYDDSDDVDYFIHKCQRLACDEIEEYGKSFSFETHD